MSPMMNSPRWPNRETRAKPAGSCSASSPAFNLCEYRLICAANTARLQRREPPLAVLQAPTRSVLFDRRQKVVYHS